MIPLGDRVLLKHLESTRDGLWLPDSAGFLQRGVVTEVGELVRWVGKGDVVMFKTDEAVAMRVPIDDPMRVPAPSKTPMVGWLPPELTPPPDAPTVADEETLYLVSEPMVYLILEKFA